MRLFLGGSNGLILYEDEEITSLHPHPINALARLPQGRMVAGTDSGMILVIDNGEAAIAAKDVGEEIHSLTASGRGVLAGTLPVGGWVSRDAGDNWEILAGFAKAPGFEDWHAPFGRPLASAIAAHPKDSETIYIGVEVGGLYRTRDSGATWFDLEIPGPDVHSIQVSPQKSERVYATTGQGAFVSEDEGFSWRAMSIGIGSTYTMGLSAHPYEADRVVISSAKGPPGSWSGKEGAGCDVYLSTDGGRRFRTVAKNLKGAVQRKALVINPRVPSEVVFGTSTGELHYSNDGGESFDLMADNLGNLKTLAFA